MRYLPRFIGTLLGVGMLSLCARPALAQTEAVFDVTTDAIGSIRMMTDANQQVVERHDFLPFGEEWNAASAMSAVKFAGKERDAESGLDYFGARYNSSSMGRFMSPDPLGGHLEDPQSLNKYVYVRNNPLILTDPTGLDFYLRCEETDENKQTCHGGYVGTFDKSNNFTRTVVTSDSIRAGRNSAFVNENGVQITTGQGTFSGEFFQNEASVVSNPETGGVLQDRNPINLGGSGKLSPFFFNINGNCGGTCLSSGSFQFNGTPDQARAALNAAGAWNYGFGDALNSTPFGHHPYTDQFRFGSGPSPHLSVPWDFIPGEPTIINPLSTVSATGDFHVDSATGTSHFWCANFRIGCNK